MTGHQQLPIEQDLAARLREALDTRDMSMTDLCRRVGVDYSTVRSFLNGRDRVSLSRVWQWFDALGYDVNITSTKRADWTPDEPLDENVTQRSKLLGPRRRVFDRYDTEEL